jgi:hypothetical protein
VVVAVVVILEVPDPQSRANQPFREASAVSGSQQSQMEAELVANREVAVMRWGLLRMLISELLFGLVEVGERACRGLQFHRVA